MEKQILQEILDFMEKAGALALENQATAQNELKADNSIVTETDLAISKMAHEMFAHWLEKEDHILIDEESIDQIGTPEEVFANSTYQWVLDPIDGTAIYAAGLPLWAISLAVLKNGKPYIAAVAIPAIYKTYLLNEAVITEVNTLTKETQKLNIKVPKLTSSSVLVASNRWTGGIVSKNFPCKVIDYSTCTIGTLYAALGKAVGAIEHVKLWDHAASWSFAQQTGVSYTGLKSGKKITQWSPENLQENWRLKELQLIASPKNYAKLYPLCLNNLNIMEN